MNYSEYIVDVIMNDGETRKYVFRFFSTKMLKEYVRVLAPHGINVVNDDGIKVVIPWHNIKEVNFQEEVLSREE